MTGLASPLAAFVTPDPAADAAMPAESHKTRRDLPPFEDERYLNWFSMCHRRLQALHQIAQGHQRPDDSSWVNGVVKLLALHGWTPRDFGFVDPPTFEVKPNTGILFAAQDTATANWPLFLMLKGNPMPKHTSRGVATPAKGLRLVACAPSHATPPIKETLPPGPHWTDAAIEKHGDLGTLRLIADMRQFAAVMRADAKFAKREAKCRAAGEFVSPTISAPRPITLSSDLGPRGHKRTPRCAGISPQAPRSFTMSRPWLRSPDRGQQCGVRGSRRIGARCVKLSIGAKSQRGKSAATRRRPRGSPPSRRTHSNVRRLPEDDERAVADGRLKSSKRLGVRLIDARSIEFCSTTRRKGEPQSLT